MRWRLYFERSSPQLSVGVLAAAVATRAPPSQATVRYGRGVRSVREGGSSLSRRPGRSAKRSAWARYGLGASTAARGSLR